MGGTITAMRLQARNKNRVVVYLDGQGTLGLAKAVASRLAVGQALTDEAIERLRIADAEEDAYQRGLRLLSLRPRSEREIRLYYARHRIPGEVQEAALARLGDVGLIDDRGFARQWVENRQTFRPRSSLALKSELRQKGVPAEAIEGALAAVDDEAAAYQVASRAARRLKGLSYEDFRRRLAGSLARRGFGYEIIRPLIERFWRETAGSVEESEGVQCNRSG